MDALTAAPAQRSHPLLPPEAPLAVPVRPLHAAPPVRGSLAGGPRAMALRRFFVIGGAVALTSFGAAEIWQVLGLSRWTVSGAIMTGIFALLFFWLALAFTSALAGFALLLCRAAPDAQPAMPGSRTALLMPIFNEPLPRITAALAAMRQSLVLAGGSDAFDIFILSDTRDPLACDAESEVCFALARIPGPAIYYRHRVENEGRKSGNIAEWLARFGAAYEHFLILDADSLMEADTLLRLVARMEAEPRLGLLQTLPMLHGGRTAFARFQQFAGQVYGPVIAEGLGWWSGWESNYWGHNAIIRTRAFAEAAGLPELPGRKPFGGTIMSHDFVEAALLRRAGWAVAFAPELSGSYEEGPPNLPEMAVRDRRWCQGNLQHLAVIGTPGLHPVSRLHLLNGIFAYLNAPLWLGYLLLGLAVALQARFLRPEYFPATYAIFPQWPVVDAERAIWVFAGTFFLLLSPKLMGMVAFAASRQGPRSLGGLLRLIQSVFLEILVSALLSPVTMLTQARQCVSVLRGADGGWKTQQREGSEWSLSASLKLMRGHVALGLLLTGLSLMIDPGLTIWMAPVLIGLILAPALVAWTSGEAAGTALRDHGLLVIPAEQVPPPILRLAAQGAS